MRSTLRLMIDMHDFIEVSPKARTRHSSVEARPRQREGTSGPRISKEDGAAGSSSKNTQIYLYWILDPGPGYY